MTLSLTSLLINKDDSLTPDDGVVQIALQILEKFNIDHGQRITIILGRKEISGEVQAIDAKTNLLAVSPKIMNAFGLPVTNGRFLAKYIPGQSSLYLGPVVGLLTDFKLPETPEPDFRSIHAFCAELDQWIREMGGFFYVFSYTQFPFRGYYFDDGKWKQAKLPLPDVIYNRIHSRKEEHSDSFHTFRKDLDQLGIPIFNDRFLSKWEVYVELNKAIHLSPYLPETTLLSKKSFIEMIQKYETVFVKPVHGSQGKNIMKVMKTEENQYTITSSIKQPAETSTINLSTPALYQYIKPLLQNRIYLVQQGVSFLTYQSCPMDFRVLCHKNKDHRWKVTSIVARVGAKEDFVSNLARGGRGMRPLAVLISWMDRKKSMETLQWVKELACNVAEKIGNAGQGIVGELGIDIGVDQSGKPWLIEVNSKPSKAFEDYKGNIRPSAKAITTICTALAFDSMIEREFG